jgi:hypothetical protein
MTAPTYVMPPLLTVHGQPDAPDAEQADLLRQLISLQKEQVALLKAQQANQDSGAKARAFLARWEGELPGIGAACRLAVPALERAYLALVRELAEKVAADPEALSDEFLLSEFLDRYGMRLVQLANILGQMAPLADTVQEKG